MTGKVKIGVLGAYRGTSMINYCEIANNAEVVAICDRQMSTNVDICLLLREIHIIFRTR